MDIWIFYRSSRSQTFFKNFAIFTGKYQCWSLSLIKSQAFRPIDSANSLPLWEKFMNWASTNWYSFKRTNKDRGFTIKQLATFVKILGELELQGFSFLFSSISFYFILFCFYFWNLVLELIIYLYYRADRQLLKVED